MGQPEQKTAIVRRDNLRELEIYAGLRGLDPDRLRQWADGTIPNLTTDEQRQLNLDEAILIARDGEIEHAIWGTIRND